MSSTAVELHRVVEAVQGAFPLRRIALPDEFFPAHLSIALIDAVFRSSASHDDDAAAAADQYCRRFSLQRTRINRWRRPAREDQETLSDLIVRLEKAAMPGMPAEALPPNQRLPETRRARMMQVRHAAWALRRCGVQVLQDVPALPRERIERTLKCAVGLDDAATRLFLMYTGGDDFVRGDRSVRRFVAGALSREEVSATKAERLVRGCAYELILAPRYLDHQIWCRVSAAPTIA